MIEAPSAPHAHGSRLLPTSDPRPSDIPRRDHDLQATDAEVNGHPENHTQLGTNGSRRSDGLDPGKGAKEGAKP